MTVSRDFIDFVLEMLEPLGTPSSRHMFGGVGIYIDSMIIALIDDDQIYFKVDDVSRPEFEAEGLSPFEYKKKDGNVGVMSYYAAPDACLDDADEMRHWAGLGFEASLRAKK